LGDLLVKEMDFKKYRIMMSGFNWFTTRSNGQSDLYCRQYV